jgi:hypothetical protein
MRYDGDRPDECSGRNYHAEEDLEVLSTDWRSPTVLRVEYECEKCGQAMVASVDLEHAHADFESPPEDYWQRREADGVPLPSSVDEDNLLTDGGSKYVVETGAGYETIVSVSQRKGVIMLASIDAVDWGVGTSVYACADREGIRLATAEVGERIAGPYSTHEPNSGGRVAVGFGDAVADHLGVPDGGDVRVYGHDDGGLLLVNAEDDPRVDSGDGVATDGGIGIIRLPYVCRTCGADTDIYGSPERAEDGDLLVGRTHRLCRNYCKECDAERTFVIAFDVAGHELEAPSYPRMPALEEEQRVATDGGSHLVKACPECDSSNIRINTPGSIHGAEPGGRCYCCTCEQYFDEPAERETQGRSNTPAAGEETLKAMDPDELLTDGGEGLPEPWPRGYDAVTHGARVSPDCLALTGDGHPCVNGATRGPDGRRAICGMHDSANDPDVMADAHQWVRIVDGDRTVAVCPNCEAVWRGGPPALRVACPTCDAAPGDRCSKPVTASGGHLLPHPERRRVVQDRVAELETCPESPLGDREDEPDDGAQQKLADGGRSELQLDDRLLDAQNDDDDAYVRVVTPRPDTRVDQHVVYETDDGTEQTVFDYHRGEVPASDSVVDVVYEESLEAAFGDADAMPRADILDFLRTYAIDSFVANGSKVTVYSFPRSRLERVGEACAECEADAADFMSGGGDEAGGNGGGA